MKMITIKQLAELVDKEPVAKHLDYFANEAKVSYPEVWYQAWLKGMLQYLEARSKRCTGS